MASKRPSRTQKPSSRRRSNSGADLSARKDWSLPLLRPVKMKRGPTFRTLADARGFILDRLPAEWKARRTWHQVAGALLESCRSGDATAATVALELVLLLEGCLDRI